MRRRRSSRSYGGRRILCRFTKERNSVAVFDEVNAVTNGEAVTVQACGKAAAFIERDDRQLVGRIRNRLLRPPMGDGSRFKGSRFQPTPRIMTTAVAPV